VDAVAAAAGEFRFRTGPREDLDAGAPPADLTIRVSVPETIEAADLARLSASLFAALAPASPVPPPPAGEPGMLPTFEREAAEPPTEIRRSDERRTDAPRAAGGAEAAPSASAEPLPAEVELAIPAERLLPVVGVVRVWRRALGGGPGGAPVDPGAPAVREGIAVADEAYLDVTILDGLSFDADPATLEAILRDLIAAPRGGEAPGKETALRAPDAENASSAASTAGAAGRAPGAASAAAAAPLRVRIVLVAERPAEPPR
jgi:hypothetical protein